ncbi:F-box family protein, partial [Striga asiatica]
TLSWDVWEMRPETRVWRKAFSVDLEKERWRFEEVFLYEDDGLTPVGRLNYPEGMVFAPSRGRYCILYWVRMREIESIDLPRLAKYYKYWSYQSSLVPPRRKLDILRLCLQPSMILQWRMDYQSDPKLAVTTQSPAGVMARCNRTPNIESLTEDLLFDILIRLTSRDIRNSARLVCRKWAHSTRSLDFTRLHHNRAAATGLLLQNTRVPKDLIFISGSRGRVEKSRARYRSGPHILGTSHGLVVVNTYTYTPLDFDPCTLRIMNPGTSEYIELPPHFGRENSRNNTCLTYAAASMEYKVVQVCNKLAKGSGALLYECDILSVGSYDDGDTWRHVRTDHLSREAKSLLSMGPPMSTEGFVHWVPYSGGSTVLTLDAETEVLTESPMPNLGHLGKKKFFLVSGGKDLTLVVKLGRLSWDVWEMNPETGVWRKAFSVDLEKEKWRFEEKFVYEDDLVVPVGWLNYPEGMVFAPNRGRYCILYWVGTGEIESIDLPTLAKCYKYWSHQSSLVPPPEM